MVFFPNRHQYSYSLSQEIALIKLQPAITLTCVIVISYDCNTWSNQNLFTSPQHLPFLHNQSDSLSVNSYDDCLISKNESLGVFNNDSFPNVFS